jgi:hypothetical protein
VYDYGRRGRTTGCRVMSATIQLGFCPGLQVGRSFQKFVDFVILRGLFLSSDLLNL